MMITLLGGPAGCSSMESIVSVPKKQSSATVAPYELETFQQSVHLFDPVPLTDKVTLMKLQRRLDNLLVIVDDRGVAETYRDVPVAVYTREIFRRFNRTIPRIDLRGNAWRLGDKGEGMAAQAYQPIFIEQRLNEGESLPSIGSEDLSEAIDIAGDYAGELKGRTGLLLITDWNKIDIDVIESIQRFRQRGLFRQGFKVIPDVDQWSSVAGPYCVFSVGVGNSLSRTRLDQVDQCGFSSAADKIAQPRDMAHFVERLLFTVPADSDGDGIYDFQDECGSTPSGRIVNKRGCLRFGNSN